MDNVCGNWILIINDLGNISGILDTLTDIHDEILIADNNGEIILTNYQSVYGYSIIAPNVYSTYYTNENGKFTIKIYDKRNDTVYPGTFRIFILGYKV